MFLRYYFCFFLILLAAGCKLEEPAQPVAKFDYTGGECVAPCEVAFADQSEAGIYNWTYEWNFGDGASSNARNPRHKYDAAGKFLVTLKLNGKYGTASTTDTIIVKGKPAEAPIADFTVSGGNCEAPCEITFTNTSKNSIAYNWNFGDRSDDSVSVLENPKHTYKKEGTYSVELTATGAGGKNSKKAAVIIKAAVPLSADFTFTQTGIDSVLVKFKNTSTGASKYVWDFGDSDTSHVASPEHYYKNESVSYQVKLTAYGKADAKKEKVQTVKIEKK